MKEPLILIYASSGCCKDPLIDYIDTGKDHQQIIQNKVSPVRWFGKKSPTRR
ncbi:hypothetical protein [Niabella aurantiaca]|uniref:hypothetical protein n=1 Tax=Niabella aurantiaca TaxID=379900 RepID=UPI00036C3C32|nr:hypothetical protein [Niabella aurantiaca]